MDGRMKDWKIHFCKHIQFISYTNSECLLAPFFNIYLLYRKHSSYYTRQKHLKLPPYDSHFGYTGPKSCRFQRWSLLPSPPMEPTRLRPWSTWVSSAKTKTISLSFIADHSRIRCNTKWCGSRPILCSLRKKNNRIPSLYPQICSPGFWSSPSLATASQQDQSGKKRNQNKQRLAKI